MAKVINSKRRFYGYVGEIEEESSGGCVLRFDTGESAFFVWTEIRRVGS